MKLFKCSCVMSDQPHGSKAAIGASGGGDPRVFRPRGADLGEESGKRVSAVVDMRGKLIPTGDGAMLRMVGMAARDQHRGHAELMCGAEIVRQVVEHRRTCRRHRVGSHEAFVSAALGLWNKLCGMYVEHVCEMPVKPEPRHHRL